MSFLDNFNILHPHIKGYTYFGWFIKKELGSEEIIGINAASSSVIRKSDIITRVQQSIKSLNLPLIIQEDNDRNKYFKILLK